MNRAAALRSDIQALRGYAVMLVVLYHAGLPWLPSGYLGVDIFFVVSGYLICGGVLRDIAAERFSVARFYLRRLRRLVPAAYAMLLAVMAVGVVLLTPSAQSRFVPQVLGVLTDTTNIVLWRQINYFNTSAGSEPLLHMWSLAIEEQFYLLLPLALCAVPRRATGWAIALVTGTSMALYLALSSRSPGFAFYLLPTRAWELGLGAAAAWVSGRATTGVRGWRIVPAARLLAVLVLAVVPCVDSRSAFMAVAVCLATAVLMPGGAGHGRWLRPLERVGDVSYSLYLAHWPLFAFAQVVWLGAPVPMGVRCGLVALSLMLGWALFHGVEQPWRWRPLAPRRVVIAWLAGTVALALLAVAAGRIGQERGAALDLSGVTGLDRAGCVQEGAAFDRRCATSPTPDTLVWGDSFSQHLIPALLASGATRIVQASKGQCAPLPGMAPVDRDAPLAFARDCLAFNARVLDYLRRTPGIGVVVLSGYYQRYAQPGTLALGEDGSMRVAGEQDLILAQARATAAIRAMGKRVVVVTGPPQARFDVGQCHERRRLGLPSMIGGADCAITPAETALTRGWAARVFAGFAGGGQTPVLALDRLICPDPARCATQRDGVVLYRDANHLGHAGSVWVGQHLALATRVRQAAR